MKKIIFAFALIFSIHSVGAATDTQFEQNLHRQIKNIEVLQSKISSEKNISTTAKQKCLGAIKTQIKWLKNQENPFDKKSIVTFVSREQRNNQKCIELIQNSRFKQLKQKIGKLKTIIKDLKNSGKSVEGLEKLLKQADSKLPLLRK